MNLFSDIDESEVEPKLLDYILRKDKKGIVNYLSKLSQKSFNEEVLKAGYSMIGFHHSKREVINHVFRQIKFS